MKHLIWGIFALIIVIIGYFSLIGVNQEIIQKYPAIEFDDINHMELNKTTVKIEGILTKKTFLEDEFNGRIEINNNELTKKEPMFIELIE